MISNILAFLALLVAVLMGLRALKKHKDKKLSIKMRQLVTDMQDDVDMPVCDKLNSKHFNLFATFGVADNDFKRDVLLNVECNNKDINAKYLDKLIIDNLIATIKKGEYSLWSIILLFIKTKRKHYKYIKIHKNRTKGDKYD